jgi:AraC family transcriptional regulator
MNTPSSIAPMHDSDIAVLIINPFSKEPPAGEPSSGAIPAYCPSDLDGGPNRGILVPWQRKKVLAYIEQNLTSTIRLEQLAALVRLSVSHFSRAFRLTFSKAPYGFILERRMLLAKELMLHTNISLSQIALDCGMTDQAHLCKVFRKTFGISPNRWRQPHRKANVPLAQTFH